jgi:hypothetical protein
MYGAESEVKQEERLKLLEQMGISYQGGQKHQPQVLVTDSQLVDLWLAGHPPDAIISSMDLSAPAIARPFEVAAQRFEQQMTMSSPFESHFNERCEVHMPGQALATYNETLLLEDACTDLLQGKIDEGWRIIAACPQPDSRRPDYILGRFNPERYNGGHGALRG